MFPPSLYTGLDTHDYFLYFQFSATVYILLKILCTFLYNICIEY